SWPRCRPIRWQNWCAWRQILACYAPQRDRAGLKSASSFQFAAPTIVLLTIGAVAAARSTQCRTHRAGAAERAAAAQTMGIIAAPPETYRRAPTTRCHRRVQD